MADMTAAPRPNDQRDGEHETSLHDVPFPAWSRYTRLRWLGKWQTSSAARRSKGRCAMDCFFPCADAASKANIEMTNREIKT
jgi:hypothetical protein